MLSKKFDKDLDSHLSPMEKAISLTTKRMLEEHTLYLLALERLLRDDVKPEFMSLILPQFPLPVRWLGPIMMTRLVRNLVDSQGVGRMPKEMQDTRRSEDAQALSTILGDKKYFMGEQVSNIDTVAFGFLSGSIDLSESMNSVSPIVKEYKKHANLMAYLERMRVVVYKADSETKTELPESSAGAHVAA